MSLLLAGRARRLIGAALLSGAALLLPVAVSAHPLGNFTINHYDAIRVAGDAVLVDHVLDMAEIPTFSERADMDTNGDGAVGDDEAAAYAAQHCDALTGDLSLTMGSQTIPLAVTARGISFPQGQGAPTLRLVCELRGALPSALASVGASFAFSDSGQLERRGWREILVQGDGTTIGDSTAEAEGLTERLTHYPADLLTTPADQRSATWTVAAGGPALPPFSAPDATPVGAAVGADTPGGTAPAPVPAAAAVPNGISDFGTDISALFQSRDLTPIVVLTSLAVAFGLGALHAVSPGHGKTVMAAYLVGTRGSTRHAVGLGLAVTVSHTVGVLVLGLISLSFATIIPPERLYPILGVASGTIVIAIGSWLIVQRVIEVRRTRAMASEHDRQHAAGAEHSHAEHSHAEQAQEDHAGAEHEQRDEAAGWHSHGGIRHTHLPSSSKELSWRGLVALGLAGGMVPSVSALILLLGSLSLGRPAFGVVLTVAFGLGMAVVLVGVGVALVRARSLVERFGGVGFGRSVGRWLPAATAVVVVLAGALMTVQALTLVS